MGAGGGAACRRLGSVSEAPPIDKSRTAVLYPSPVATLGHTSARFERELLMKSSITPKGMECRIWNGVDITRRPSDGYVNATAMCKAYGKRWENYHRNERTQQYIAALERILAKTDCGAAVARNRVTGKPDLIQTIQGGPPHLQGTWVHPRIAVDLARWLHPEFAVWMDGWFLEDFAPRIAADPTPATAPLPKPQQEKPVYMVGGPGVYVPGAEAFTAPLTEILDAYTSEKESEYDALPRHERLRPFRSPRFATKTFLEWFVAKHGQLVLSPASIGITVGAVAAPPRPPAPPAPAPQPARDHHAPARPPQAEQRFQPGDLITGPELAHLLGIRPGTLNHWAAEHNIGTEPDGWRLIGRGKLSAGKLCCSTYPPGCASWLFMKL